jgi:hypothetical protein
VYCGEKDQLENHAAFEESRRQAHQAQAIRKSQEAAGAQEGGCNTA